MTRNTETHRISAEVSDRDPKGMGVAGILTSDLFGLRSHLDLGTLELLDEQRELATKDKLNARERARPAELNGLLENQDFAKAVRDPLYPLFVEAISKLDAFRATQTVELSHDQRERRKRIAQAVLAKIRAQKHQPE